MSRREYPDRPVAGVGGVVVDAEARVVLVRRRFDPLAGRWSLPGGMVELGESLERAVSREVFEETGLEVAVGPLVDAFDRITADAAGRVRYHYVLADYLCSVVGGTLQPGTDVSDAVWAGPAELAAYDLTTKATEIIERALRLARAHRP